MNPDQRKALVSLWQSRRQTAVFNPQPHGYLIIAIAPPGEEPPAGQVYCVEEEGEHQRADRHWRQYYDTQLSLF